MYFQNFQKKISQDSQFLQENCYQCLNCLIGAQHDPGFLPPILQPTQKYLSSKLFLLNPNFPSCGFYLQKRMLVAPTCVGIFCDTVSPPFARYFFSERMCTVQLPFASGGFGCVTLTHSPLFKIYIYVYYVYGGSLLHKLFCFRFLLKQSNCLKDIAFHIQVVYSS